MSTGHQSGGRLEGVLVNLRTLVVAGAVSVASTLACGPGPAPQPSGYFDSAGRPDLLSGGARRIPVTTPAGTFTVWTKRVGNNPTVKLLLLHGGPGATSEYFEAADSYLPGAGVEYYYYDQLGSFRSDQPGDARLLDIDRFVDEVEQVRQALGLDRSSPWRGTPCPTFSRPRCCWRSSRRSWFCSAVPSAAARA